MIRLLKIFNMFIISLKMTILKNYMFKIELHTLNKNLTINRICYILLLEYCKSINIVKKNICTNKFLISYSMLGICFILMHRKDYVLHLCHLTNRIYDDLFFQQIDKVRD